MINQRKILIENITSLYLLQVSGYIIPLIILPFLVRKLGSETYGLMVFSFSLVQYFIIVTDYGFNLSATRRVAICRSDRRVLSEIFTVVSLIKCVAMVVSFLVFLGIIMSVKSYHNHYQILLVSFLSVLGNVIFPVWLFQGLEKIKHLALLFFAGRIVSLVALLIFIRSSDDVVLAVFIQTLGILVPGVFGIMIIVKDKLVDIVAPSKKVILDVLSDGWPIFISQVSISLFTNTGIFLLGSFYNYESAGYFAIADKIVKAVCGLSIPIVNGIYPRVSSLFANSQQIALQFLRRVLLWGGSLLLSSSVSLFFFAPNIVRIITGNEQSVVVVLVRIMAIVPFSVFVDNIYGTQILLNIQRERIFMIIIVISGIISLLGMLLFVPQYGAVAASTVFTVTELILLGMMIVAVRQEGIRLLTTKIF